LADLGNKSVRKITYWKTKIPIQKKTLDMITKQIL
jgi:hypothetical protein